MRTTFFLMLLFSLNIAFGYNQGDILFQESKSSNKVTLTPVQEWIFTESL